MKKTVFKVLWRKIIRSTSQYLSIIAISAIGVAMYVGILSVPTTMQDNAQRYLEQQNASDLELIKTSGFSNKDIDKIKKNEKNITVEKNIILDANAKYEDQEIVSRIHTNSKISNPAIIKGRNLEKKNECLVDDENNHLLNKSIKVEANDKTKKCKVVGTIYSPNYLSSKNKGYSSISTGQVKMIMYTSKSFAKDFFSEFPYSYVEPYNSLSITFNNKPSNQTFSSQYQDYINKKEKDVKELFKKNEITITSRDDNTSIDSYYTDSSRIREIGAIFPVIFFLVAALVGSTTMSRMVEDERMQIGVISSLGYSKLTILMMYLIYSLSAVLIGCGIGIFAGFNLIPTTVLKAYSVMYKIPEILVYYNFDISIQAIIIAVVLIVGATLLVTLFQIKDSCATLLRPKAPLAGKKIILEKVTFFWNRLSFINKVSIRNIFRYKKRLFMTILAIMGCSGLLMTGLGIQSSVMPIVDKQFDDIYDYQMIAYNSPLSYQKASKEIKKLEKVKDIDGVLATNRKNAVAYKGKKENNFTIISPDNEEKLNNYINFSHPFTKDDVFITQKLADTFNIGKGDTFKFEFDEKDYQLTITGITEQYVGNYIYVNNKEFNKVFSDKEFNSFFIKHHGKTAKIIEELEKNSYFSAIDDDTIYQDTISDSISGINNLVYIMIAFAGLLVIVVMYSLTNINLIERRRELATLKVLGFYNREVSNYVLKENILLTILGLFVGLIFGKYLHLYILSRIEVPDIYFIREQPITNYLIAFSITILFSLSVNLIMQRKIKKIDLVDSLKSVE